MIERVHNLTGILRGELRLRTILQTSLVGIADEGINRPAAGFFNSGRLTGVQSEHERSTVLFKQVKFVTGVIRVGAIAELRPDVHLQLGPAQVVIHGVDLTVDRSNGSVGGNPLVRSDSV